MSKNALPITYALYRPFILVKAELGLKPGLLMVPKLATMTAGIRCSHPFKLRRKSNTVVTFAD
jgi:hypothetical protein